MAQPIGMSKAALARHLTQPHGEARSLVPLPELRTWLREELEAEHRRLQKCGPCKSPVSFRDDIHTKAVGQ